MMPLVLFLLLLASALLVWCLARCKGLRQTAPKHAAQEPLQPGTERRILDSLNTVPWEWDLVEGRYTFVGKRMEVLFGYPLDQWYETKLWRDSIYPEDIELVERSFMRAVWTGGDGAYQYRVLHANGSVILVESCISAVLEDGKPRFVCGTTRCVENKE